MPAARAQRLAALFRTLTGGRRLAAAFGLGTTSVLALSPFDLWWMLFLTLPPLVWLIDGIATREVSPRGRLRPALALGWAFGFGYFLFGLYWIGKAFLVEAGVLAIMMPLAMTALPAGLALFHAAAIAAAALFWQPDSRRLFMLATALAGADWLRGHILTGFPWNLFSQIFVAEPGLSQLFALVGPYALSLLAVFAAASPALVADGDSDSARLRNFTAPLAAAGLLALGAWWGHGRLAGNATQFDPDLRLRIVQPNIEQQDKWKPGNAGPIYRLMLQLSGKATPENPGGLDSITHLIWPESALPFFIDRSQEGLDGIAALLPDTATLITGAERYETVDGPDGNAGHVFYNGLAVLDGDGRITARFDKKHLVPFGEYLPLQTWLEAIGLRELTHLRGGFAAGAAPRLLQPAGTPPFAPLICYEVVFPGETVEAGERPRWLVNVTNDAWYGVSTGPYQHLTQSRLRAIETGLPLVRAANTGISAIIDPLGRVVRSLPLATQGVIDAPLPASIAPPPYARFGDLPFAALLLLGLILSRIPRYPPARD